MGPSEFRELEDFGPVEFSVATEQKTLAFGDATESPASGSEVDMPRTHTYYQSTHRSARSHDLGGDGCAFKGVAPVTLHSPPSDGDVTPSLAFTLARTSCT